MIKVWHMERQYLSIGGIPAIFWGPAAEELFLAVHGDQSHKADAVVAILAEEAVRKGYRVLSFDLPEHGGRKSEPRLCKAQNCVEDLQTVLESVRGSARRISLFGCSLGAYFSMLAYGGDAIRQALFLSPVVDMTRIIQNMMGWFDVSEERLRREQEVATPIKTLYWDYYQYVLAHPVQWDKPTAILYGAKDNLCEAAVVQAFAERARAELTVMEDGEHFFHTGEQLAFLRRWLGARIEET